MTAVQDFWGSDPQYENDEDCANFVEWVIAAEDEDLLPFTWGSVDETDSDNVINNSPIFATVTFSDTNKYQIYNGSFQSATVIVTFSTHLAPISHLPPDMLINNEPEGALSMATNPICLL